MPSSRSLYKSIALPTGEFPDQVCVGDLPTYDYSVSLDTLTEDITKHLEMHSDLPGVILLKDGKLSAMIPRDRIFERLGHRYGVELFMRKPVGELQKVLDIELFSIASHLGIREAVHYALERPAGATYEPIVIVHEEQNVRMLDIYTLLVAQTQLMNNLNNLVRNFNRIKTALSKNMSLDRTLEVIMKGLKQVVPYHHAAVFLKEPIELRLSTKQSVQYLPTQPAAHNVIYQSILKTNHPIYLEDVNKVPAWKGLPFQDDLRTWMGFPLKSGSRSVGVLSLARRTLSPFRKDEMDMAQVFADYMGVAFSAHSKVNPN